MGTRAKCNAGNKHAPPITVQTTPLNRSISLQLAEIPKVSFLL